MEKFFWVCDINLMIVCGADFAFVRDSSAVVFVSLLDGVFKVERERVWKPSNGLPLKPTVVFLEALEEIRDMGAEGICADAHYWAAVVEQIESTGVELTQFPSDQKAIAEVFVRMRILFGAGRIDLTLASDQLVTELKATTGKPTAGGTIAISHPRVGASHGDCARALASAIYLLELGATRTPDDLSSQRRRIQSARRYGGEPERRGDGYLCDTAEQQFKDDPDMPQRVRAGR